QSTSTNNAAPTLAPILTRVSQIRRLGAEADRGFSVRLRGVVTYYDARYMLFVQDESGGIYVYPDQQSFAVRAGQLVEVDGVTHSGLYAPVINDPRFTVLGESESPEAKTISAETLLRGQHDSQRVEVSGVIYS